jgi:hypothetical protein
VSASFRCLPKSAPLSQTTSCMAGRCCRRRRCFYGMGHNQERSSPIRSFGSYVGISIEQASAWPVEARTRCDTALPRGWSTPVCRQVGG